MFEDARQRLVAALVLSGRQRLAAEKISLYVIQGVREMPRLISLLCEGSPDSPAKILEALQSVLDNADALDKAKELLLDTDTGPCL